MKQSSILYQRGNFWVIKTAKSYEIYEDGPVHSVRRGIVGLTLPGAWERVLQIIQEKQAT